MKAAAIGDRGQQADRPTKIPARGWKDVLLRVKDEIGRDNLSIIAAGVAFFGLLAAFPAISALVLVYGLVADPAQVEQHLAPLRDVMPGDAFEIVRTQTLTVASQGAAKLSLGLLISLALAIWSTNSGTKAIFTALNVAYEEIEERGFIRLNLVALAFTLGALLFFIVAMTVIAAIPAALKFLGLAEGPIGTVLLWSRWLVMAALMMAALAVVYRYGPSRHTARFEWVTPGAIVATVLWIVGSVAFSIYVANFASYNKTFGSLGAVVILLMWFYISAYVICLGAELNAELERQTERDSTTGPEKPVGERGAYVADNKAQTPNHNVQEVSMYNIFWLIGVIVVILAVLSLLGLR